MSMDRAEIMAWRKTTRDALIAQRVALPLDEYQLISDGAFRWLEEIFLQHLKKLTVGLYWPIRRELNPLPFAERLIAAGGTAALPVINEPGDPLRFRTWAPGDPMAKGVWDIPQPAGGAWVTPDALVIPLVGFDPGGYRLGYGGGYYDRALEGYSRPMTIGVGLEDSRLETIHPLDHDVPLDFIVTDDGVFERAAEDR